MTKRTDRVPNNSPPGLPPGVPPGVPLGFSSASANKAGWSWRWARLGQAVLLLWMCGYLLMPQGVIADDTPQADNLAQAGAPGVSSPLADPVVHSDALFFARKVTAWNDGGSSYMLLEGDAGFLVGVYGFRADRAVVRIDTEVLPGRRVRHLWIYLDNARHLSGHGKVAAEAKRLLVTASTVGAVMVDNDLFVQSDIAPEDELVAAAAARVQRHYAALARVTIQLPQEPLFDPAIFETRLAKQREQDRPIIPSAQPAPTRQPGPKVAQGQPDEVTQPVVPAPAPGVTTTDTDQVDQAGLADAAAVPGAVDPAAPVQDPDIASAQVPPRRDDSVLPAAGSVSMIADRTVYDPGKDGGEPAVILIGNVRVLYRDDVNHREVTLRAQRVVVFLEPDAQQGPIPSPQMDAGKVRGVYLEDNVIVSDTDFTVRAPRAYYDIKQDKATLLDAVIYSFDATRQLPLYVRARMVQQTSATSFAAEDVLVTTSEFAEPHFAIGAARITLDQQQVQGGVVNRITATKTSLQVRNQPLFYWPYLEGNATDIPLKRVKVGFNSDNGPEFETTWDLFALAGREAPNGVKLLGRADVIGDHGPAAGVDLEYGLPNMFGKAQGYLLLNDDGTDEIGDRLDVEQDGEVRGFYQWQHRHFLANGSELSIESAFVSDETFLEEFFRDQANESKPFETSIYWKMQEADQALTFLARYDLTDFTPQLATLQTPGYTVDKAPEIGFYRTGTSLWEDRLTYFTENRIGFVRARPGRDSPLDRGFNNADSMRLFGIPNTTDFEDALFATGVPDEWVFRADSRHEISAPMRAGDVNIVPYAVGRITVYDEDFSAFAGEDEKTRLWGSLGVRTSTSMHKSYDKQSRLLDINGIRHVVEPSVDVFFSGANINSDDLPVYDADVEGIQEGAGIRLGLTNTLQTKRGGPGRWRAVDWVVLKTDLVLRSDDSDVDTDIARFFEHRPEFSRGGDHLYTELLWMVTDTLGLAGELTHSLETDRVVQWRFGGTLDHSPRLSSFLRYDEIDILASRLLSWGFTYQMTIKYALGVRQQIDFAEDESRSFDLWLERRLPRWRVRFQANIDEIEDDQTIGIVLIPEGFGGGPARLIR